MILLTFCSFSFVFFLLFFFFCSFSFFLSSLQGINFSAIFIEGQGPGPDLCKVPKENATPVVLRKEAKLKAGEGAQIGEWNVQTPGVVKITFDNTYSWMRGKTIKYSFDVRDVTKTTVAAAAALWKEKAHQKEEGGEETKA